MRKYANWFIDNNAVIIFVYDWQINIRNNTQYSRIVINIDFICFPNLIARLIRQAIYNDFTLVAELRRKSPAEHWHLLDNVLVKPLAPYVLDFFEPMLPLFWWISHVFFTC